MTMSLIASRSFGIPIFHFVTLSGVEGDKMKKALRISPEGLNHKLNQFKMNATLRRHYTCSNTCKRTCKRRNFYSFCFSYYLFSISFMKIKYRLRQNEKRPSYLLESLFKYSCFSRSRQCAAHHAVHHCCGMGKICFHVVIDAANIECFSDSTQINFIINSLDALECP